jgi:hypothetical protein
MKKFFSLLMLYSGICCADADYFDEYAYIDQYHYYWDLSVGPLPMPSMGPGVGLRIREDRVSIDMGLSFRTLFIYNTLDERLSILYYFSPAAKSFYIGGGAKGQQFVAAFIEDNHKFMTTYGFHLIFGHERNMSDSFTFRQIEISTPQKVYWGEEDYVSYLPDITLRFGMGF